MKIIKSLNELSPYLAASYDRISDTTYYTLLYKYDLIMDFQEEDWIVNQFVFKHNQLKSPSEILINIERRGVAWTYHWVSGEEIHIGLKKFEIIL